MTVSRPPSTRLNSTFALNNAARWLVAEVGKGNHDSVFELVDRKAPNGVYITREMADYVEDFTEVNVASNDVSITHEYCGISGTIDRAWMHQGALYIDRLEYGWGIVEPENNWTLIFHAIAYCVSHKIQPQTIHLSIFQPRPHHHAGKHRTWTIASYHLDELQSELIASVTHPENTLNTGPQCTKCPSNAVCPAARKADLNAIEASERVFDDTISNEELSVLMDENNRAQKQLKASEDALTELARFRLKQGQVIDNYTIEVSYSNLQWLDFVTPEFAKVLTGFDLSKPGLITPTQAKKLGVPDEVIKSFATKTERGAKLVRESADSKAKRLLKNK